MRSRRLAWPYLSPCGRGRIGAVMRSISRRDPGEGFRSIEPSPQPSPSTTAAETSNERFGVRVQFVPAGIGSRPLLMIAALAAGEARNLISALPASGSFDTLAIPAENTVIFCKSAGSGPTISTARHRQHFADLLEADLGVAARDDLADRRRRNFPGLVLHLVGDAELLEHLGRDIDAAGAVGIGDRLRRQQRALDRVGGTDVGLRRA